MTNELLEIFSDIKKTIYKHNLQEYNMEPLFLKIQNLKIKEDFNYFQSLFTYMSCMHTNLESIGTKIVEMQKYIDYISSGDIKSFLNSQKKFEDILLSMFLHIDNFIDSITAFSKLYQIKGQEYEFIKTVMELRSKRDLLMKLTSAYMSKLIKGVNDSNELRFFLGDFLDSLLVEAYRLQLNKIIKYYRPFIYQNAKIIEELY